MRRGDTGNPATGLVTSRIPSEVGENLTAVRMSVQPCLDVIGTNERLVSKLSPELFFGEMTSFCVLELCLKGVSEYVIKVHVEPARLEGLPFVAVQPDTATVVTMVDGERVAVGDAVSPHRVVAVRTPFQTGRVLGRNDG